MKKLLLLLCMCFSASAMEIAKDEANAKIYRDKDQFLQFLNVSSFKDVAITEHYDKDVVKKFVISGKKRKWLIVERIDDKEFNIIEKNNETEIYNKYTITHDTLYNMIKNESWRREEEAIKHNVRTEEALEEFKYNDAWGIFQFDEKFRILEMDKIESIE